MKALLNYTDTKYLKRLVREVNALGLLGDGVFWNGTRYSRARLRNVRNKGERFPTFELCSIYGDWIAPTIVDDIVDTYGRNVRASRVQ